MSLGSLSLSREQWRVPDTRIIFFYSLVDHKWPRGECAKSGIALLANVDVYTVASTL